MFVFVFSEANWGGVVSKHHIYFHGRRQPVIGYCSNCVSQPRYCIGMCIISIYLVLVSCRTFTCSKPKHASLALRPKLREEKRPRNACLGEIKSFSSAGGGEGVVSCARFNFPFCVRALDLVHNHARLFRKVHPSSIVCGHRPRSPKKPPPPTLPAYLLAWPFPRSDEEKSMKRMIHAYDVSEKEKNGFIKNKPYGFCRTP